MQLENSHVIAPSQVPPCPCVFLLVPVPVPESCLVVPVAVSESCLLVPVSCWCWVRVCGRCWRRWCPRGRRGQCSTAASRAASRSSTSTSSATCSLTARASSPTASSSSSLPTPPSTPPSLTGRSPLSAGIRGAPPVGAARPKQRAVRMRRAGREHLGPAGEEQGAVCGAAGLGRLQGHRGGLHRRGAPALSSSVYRLRIKLREAGRRAKCAVSGRRAGGSADVSSRALHGLLPRLSTRRFYAGFTRALHERIAWIFLHGLYAESPRNKGCTRNLLALFRASLHFIAALYWRYGREPRRALAAQVDSGGQGAALLAVCR